MRPELHIRFLQSYAVSGFIFYVARMDAIGDEIWWLLGIILPAR